MTDAQLLANIETSLGRSLSDPERAQVALYLGYARIIVAHRLGDLTELDQDALAMVLVEAVALKMKSPDALTSRSRNISVDDASVQTTSAYEKATGQVTILDEWWSLLTPADSTGGAFSVSPGFVP